VFLLSKKGEQEKLSVEGLGLLILLS